MSCSQGQGHTKYTSVGGLSLTQWQSLLICYFSGVQMQQKIIVSIDNRRCAIDRASELRVTGRGFESWLGTIA